MKHYSVREELDQAASKNLSVYPELLRHLLYYRNVRTSDAAQKFLNPDYDSSIHDPFLMKDMEKAADRVIKAVKIKEKIGIFTDYDADGIPAGVILYDFLRNIGAKDVEIYIPDRHFEGYGMSVDAVKKLAEKGVTVLITADSGITNVKEIECANDLGMDVIITDHHLPKEVLPSAFAILNSKQKECQYPYDMLCGSGVAFKLIQGILKKESFGQKTGMEKWHLDMVGLATLADMVPLVDENRVFAAYGLKVLRKSPRLGLQKLLKLAKTDQNKLTEEDIGFTIVPRINAASRMGSSDDAFKLLISQNEPEADMLARKLNALNDERKGTVAAIVKEIKKTIAARDINMEQISVISLGNPDWRPSLLGLAANSLVEEYGKPVFLWGREGSGLLKGSARSANVPLNKILEAADSNIVLEYGGHAHAGGFVLSSEVPHLLDDELNAAYKRVFTDMTQEKESLFVDRKLSLGDVDWKLYGMIEQLSPFGFENERPVFLFENVVVSAVKQFGKVKNHLELTFNRTAKPIKAIGFFMNDESFGTKIQEGSLISLVATIEKSTFGYSPELRLRIQDVLTY